MKLDFKWPKDTNHFFTADTHFDHRNIIKYCSRPFLSSAEQEVINRVDAGELDPREIIISDESLASMNFRLSENINDVVKTNDALWMVGDAFFGQSVKRVRALRDMLNCKNIILIQGNHDDDKIAHATSIFKAVYDHAFINIGGQEIFLCHYPMRAWHRSHKGSWMLYGHVHGLYDQEDRQSTRLTLDVGVDSHNYKPWSMPQLREYFTPRREAWQQSIKAEFASRAPSQNKVEGVIA